MRVILQLFALGIGLLPEGAALALARALAFVAFDILRVRRRLVVANIQRAFPEMSHLERVAIGRASVESFVLTVFELLAAKRRDLAGNIRLFGDQNLRQALAKGQGVYVLCLHLGNWEATGAAVSRLIAPAHVIVKKVGSETVNEFVAELRAHAGFLAIRRRRKMDALLEIKKALGRGDIVGFVMDQSRPGEPYLPFFGHPARSNTGLATLWRRMPRPVVPVYAVRRSVGAHDIFCLPELTLAKTGDAKADVVKLTEEFNKTLETCIRACPGQYFWMHNRWK